VATSDSRPRTCATSTAAVKPAIFVVAAICLGYTPLLLLHFSYLWTQPQYQYFPFVLAAIAYLGWSRRGVSAPEAIIHVTSSRLFLVGVALSWAVLAAATFLISPWLGASSAVLLLLAVAIVAGTSGVLPTARGIWALSLLILPLPLGFDGRMVQRLQQLSSRLSSSALDSIGVLHVMDGNVLRLPGKDLFVDEACSGIVSVLSVVAMVGIYCVWKTRPATHSVILITLAVGWAVVMNVLRISTIAIGNAWFNIDLSTGWLHEAISLLTFLLVTLCVFSTDVLVTLLLSPIDSPVFSRDVNRLNRLFNGLGQVTKSTKWGEECAPRKFECLPRVMPWKMATYVSVPFVLLGVLQASPFLIAQQQARDGIAATESAHRVGKGDLVKLAEGWRVRDVSRVNRSQNASEGHYSTTFTIVRDKSEVSCKLSLDYPFIFGWHYLTSCYTLSGWICQSEVVIVPHNDSNWGYTKVFYRNSSGADAILFYSLFDAEGNGVAPPDGTLARQLWQRMGKTKVLSTRPTYFQVQLFTPISSRSAVDEESLEQLFLKCREDLRRSVMARARMHFDDD